MRWCTGITTILADIKIGVSQPRNMVIANIFYRLELIESYGTGIQKIMESYSDSGIDPVFLPAPASFAVTLPNRNTLVSAKYDAELSRADNILRLIAEMGSVTRRDVE